MNEQRAQRDFWIGLLWLPLCSPGDAAEWIQTWGAAPLPPTAAMGSYPATPAFNNQTIRQTIRVSQGGKRLRIRFTNEYGFSTTQHAFYKINHALSAIEDSAVAQLYFGNSGVSGNGSWVAVSQDPRTTALEQGQSQPPLHAYITQGYTGAGLYNILGFNATDRDRSQAPQSARPALDFNGAHIVVNGPKTTLYSTLSGSLGLLPDTTRAAALSHDGTVAYVLDEPSGAASGALETYDLSNASSTNANTYFTQTGTAIPMSLDSGAGAIAMTMTPDGGTLLIAGASGLYVQPTPK